MACGQFGDPAIPVKGGCVQLRDASVQDIQLELIRRTRFNAFGGERVAASLRAHRDLWTAAILDRPGTRMGGLIKLRDLSANLWNADTLFVLCTTPVAARQLAAVAEAEDWGGEAQVYGNAEAENALGGRPGCGVLSVWWD
jgi:hypothetical protein